MHIHDARGFVHSSVVAQSSVPPSVSFFDLLPRLHSVSGKEDMKRSLAEVAEAKDAAGTLL